ncbi:uncharacterized protein LOC144149810 isoform X1 [Haemaphysalis longicornis]
MKMNTSPRTPTPVILVVCAAFLLHQAAAGFMGGGGPHLTVHKDHYGRGGISLRYDHRAYGHLPSGHYGGGHGGGY